MTDDHVLIRLALTTCLLAACGDDGSTGTDGAGGSQATSGGGGSQATGGGGGSQATSGGGGSQATSGGGGSQASSGGGGDGGDAVSADGPLPSDSAIFGSAVIATYIFAPPHVETEGSPPEVVRVANAASPGTFDVVFQSGARPVFVEDCGPEGQPCARFDGVDDWGEATGLTIQSGASPSLLLVAKLNTLDTVVQIPFQITNGDGSQFVNLPEVIFAPDEQIWRYNGTYADCTHNIDFGQPDLELHLHESHLGLADTRAVFDGQLQPHRVRDCGLEGAVDTVTLGRRAPDQYAGADIFEAVLVDSPSSAAAANYREQRVRSVYPTLLE